MSAAVLTAAACGTPWPAAIEASVGDTPYDNTEGDTVSASYTFFSAAWFKFVAPATATYTINNCKSTESDTVMGAFSGSICWTPVYETASDNVPYLNMADQGCEEGNLSQVVIVATEGATYYIVVGQWNNEAGNPGTLTITEGEPARKGARKSNPKKPATKPLPKTHTGKPN